MSISEGVGERAVANRVDAGVGACEREREREFERLRESAYRLSLLAMQSDRFFDDDEFHKAVGDVFIRTSPDFSDEEEE